MNSKRIGNIGEAKVLAKFVELGIPVYLPFGDNEKADLIAEFNNKLNKIQIKTSIKAENGTMVFDLTSSTQHRKKGQKHLYNDNEIDYFACYNIQRDKIFLMNIKDITTSIVIVRYEYPKNNQISKCHFEKDFLIDNVLNKYNMFK